MNARQRRGDRPDDSVANYMSACECAVARQRAAEALKMGNWTLAAANFVVSALNDAGVALVRAVTLT